LTLILQKETQTMMKNQRILITGALGQLGLALIRELSKQENTYVLATDINIPKNELSVDFEQVNALDKNRLESLIIKHEINCIYHFAAILSANGEQNPFVSWDVNVNSFQVVVSLAIKHNIQRLFWPSSIAVYGRDKNPINAPQQVDMNPLTIYGVSKLASEKLIMYYHNKYNIDIRSLRLPGVLSTDLAGGGTTDYAVEMVQAAKNEMPYTCFLAPQTELPMVYIDDVIMAIQQLMEVDFSAHQRAHSYNIMGFSLTPRKLENQLKKMGFPIVVNYSPDYRQQIAESWPRTIYDQLAKTDWGWSPKFDLERSVKRMIS
jgi:nucleoside-diphosphate-sugar epimerase